MNIQTPLDDVNQYPFKEALEEKEEGDLRHDASFDGDFLEYRNVDDILRRFGSVLRGNAVFSVTDHVTHGDIHRVSHALADHIRTGEQMRAKVAHNDKCVSHVACSCFLSVSISVLCRITCNAVSDQSLA